MVSYSTTTKPIRYAPSHATAQRVGSDPDPSRMQYTGRHRKVYCGANRRPVAAPSRHADPPPRNNNHMHPTSMPNPWPHPNNFQSLGHPTVAHRRVNLVFLQSHHKMTIGSQGLSRVHIEYLAGRVPNEHACLDALTTKWIACKLSAMHTSGDHSTD